MLSRSVAVTVVGNMLEIIAPSEVREELRELLDDPDKGYPAAEALMAEELHERWTFIRPEEVGALTDSPILTEDDGLEYADNGDRTIGGRVVWFPNYQVTDPWRTLADDGVVYFVIADDTGVE